MVSTCPLAECTERGAPWPHGDRHDVDGRNGGGAPEDGKRDEVLDGELAVTPAPTLARQDVLGRLYVVLLAYTQHHDVGYTYLSPADIEFSSTRLVQPDVFVAAKVDGSKPKRWMEVKQLRLAVEVLSPSTAQRDRGRKRLIYQSQGVEEYWIVDIDARCVERWRPDDERPEVVHSTLSWQPEAERLPLRIDLEEMFERALGSRS